MLKQNWFCNENMEMFYDCYEVQEFYDKNTKAIYIVEDTEEGTRIREIHEESDNYNDHYNKYIQWKSQNLPVQLFVQECERILDKKLSSNDEMDILYNDATINISMLGLTTKIPWGSEPYNRIIDALKLLLEEGEIE